MDPQHSRQGGAGVVLVLLLSPLINLAINRALDHSWHQQNNPDIPVAPGHWLFSLATMLVGAIIAVLLLWLLQRQARPGRSARRMLELLGTITTLQALLNGALVLIAISVLQLGSVQLLLIGTGLYVVLNAIALFWYWCLDHPGFGSGQDMDCARRGVIGFPEGDRGGTLLDYIYFTVLSSNTLGPPENHQLHGAAAKLLQLLQSSVMLGLLVIVVARAINTLG
jgi:hypothetical protein